MTVKRYNIYKQRKKRVDAVLNVDTRMAIMQIKALKRALSEIEPLEFERILTLIQGLQRLEMTGFLGHVCPDEPAETLFKKAHGRLPEDPVDPTPYADKNDRLFQIANNVEKARKHDKARIENYARIIRKDFKWTAPEALGPKIRARLHDFMGLSRGDW